MLSVASAATVADCSSADASSVKAVSSGLTSLSCGAPARIPMAFSFFALPVSPRVTAAGCVAFAFALRCCSSADSGAAPTSAFLLSLGVPGAVQVTALGLFPFALATCVLPPPEAVVPVLFPEPGTAALVTLLLVGCAGDRLVPPLPLKKVLDASMRTPSAFWLSGSYPWV